MTVPFCASSAEAAAMDDDEFWEAVFNNPTQRDGYGSDDDNPPPVLEPCPICGETFACGYDDAGRALIHPLNEATT